MVESDACIFVRIVELIKGQELCHCQCYASRSEWYSFSLSHDNCDTTWTKSKAFPSSVDPYTFVIYLSNIMSEADVQSTISASEKDKDLEYIVNSQDGEGASHLLPHVLHEGSL